MENLDIKGILDERIKNLEAERRTTGGINHAFNDAVGQVIHFLGPSDMKYLTEKLKVKDVFGYWCGKLRGIPPSEIYGLMSQAKEGRNPQKLFSWLLKDYRAKHKVIHTTTRRKRQKGIE